MGEHGEREPELVAVERPLRFTDDDCFESSTGTAKGVEELGRFGSESASGPVGPALNEWSVPPRLALRRVFGHHEGESAPGHAGYLATVAVTATPSQAVPVLVTPLVV